ncbi:MAG: NAD(P)H-dependent oxidoreductase subunit E [Candidatus Riflebacteria bacterium]|nr:NAD(P)H-dependent oxidoreductase subunit E [Candidatus Riflebacteria bacterium]
MSCPIASKAELSKLSPEKAEELEYYLDSLPLTEDREKNRGFLIQSLHKAQEIFTYLPSVVQIHVANKLGLHLAEVNGVISFYSFFTDKPVGRFKINICTGTACFVKGADKLVEEFQRYLGLKMGETAADGKFSLTALRCVGACSMAPVVMVNDRVYGNVNAKMVPEIINDCK